MRHQETTKAQTSRFGTSHQRRDARQRLLGVDAQSGQQADEHKFACQRLMGRGAASRHFLPSTSPTKLMPLIPPACIRLSVAAC
mmetsp:Transcript_57835/g.167555  ORF Transcript_57835/g.167555 Transcript_57835/m.167555 type:complete len:84 (+) Transcript_57835:767-1018(+)